MDTETEMKKTHIVLRWIAVLFAAVLGSLIAYIIAALWIGINNVGYELYTGATTLSLTKIILGIAAQAIAGAASVYCGALTAPSNRKTCSVVIATIICIIALSSIFIYNLMHGFSFLQLIHCLASATGAIAVSYNFDEIDANNK